MGLKKQWQEIHFMTYLVFTVAIYTNTKYKRREQLNKHFTSIHKTEIINTFTRTNCQLNKLKCGKKTIYDMKIQKIPIL